MQILLHENHVYYLVTVYVKMQSGSGYGELVDMVSSELQFATPGGKSSCGKNRRVIETYSGMTKENQEND